jgi:hypothetical protein
VIVFCPNCGTQTTGLAGARATCSACASTFEVPFDAPPRTAPPPAPAPVAPPPPSFQAPGAQVFAPPVPVARARRASRTNALAVISLVAGILCCLPVVSPGVAIVCGTLALGQIKANPEVEGGRGIAIAGIILGGMTVILQLLWLIGASKRW